MALLNESLLAAPVESEVRNDVSFDPVVVVLGGFWSCGFDRNKPVGEQWSLDAFKFAGASINRIAAQISKGVKGAIRPNIGEFYSCYSVHPEKIIFVNNINSSKKMQIEDVDVMIAQLNSSLEKLRNPKVSIVGHSYGGWTAMKLALKLTPKATLSTLVTIDAISRPYCTPEMWLENLKEGLEKSPCHQAPSEFTGDEIAKIAKRANGEWYNYYQTYAKSLHSSAIGSPLLKEDLDLNYVTKDGILYAHLKFLRDETLINKIREIIVGNMKN